jgi:hypothetical protein
LLSLIDRNAFARAVRQHQPERGAKGFYLLGAIQGLKQDLKIKSFGELAENAVNVQIWAWSLSNLAAMTRFSLLSYRVMWA